MTFLHVGKQVINESDIIHAHADTDDYLTLTLRTNFSMGSYHLVLTGNEATTLWTVLKNRSIDVQNEYDLHVHEAAHKEMADFDAKEDRKREMAKVTDAERAAALEQARIKAMVEPPKNQVQAWQEALDRFIRDNGHNTQRFPYLSLGPDTIYTFHAEQPSTVTGAVVLEIPKSGTDSDRAQTLRDQLTQAIQERAGA